MGRYLANGIPARNETTGQANSSPPTPKEISVKTGNHRWLIVSLVFLATTINYLDRQVLSLLKDDYLEPLFKWTESDYARVIVAFHLTYALGIPIVGWFIDRIGTKIGYALSLAIWSCATIGHAFAQSTVGFMFARGVLGVSQSGNFPAALKAVAEWFPKRERALATGIFNSGSNIGAIAAPLTVPLIALAWGWQWAFILTGAVGFLWLALWFYFYEVPLKHKTLRKEEYDYIHSDREEGASTPIAVEKVVWLRLFTFRQTWAFATARFITDPVWWFYLFWLPTFLYKQYGISKTDLMLPITVVYLITTAGSVFGGWLSGRLISKGWPVFKARRAAMLIFAGCALPVIFIPEVGRISHWFTVLFIGIAAAGHQAWSANLLTTPADMFPKKTVASLIGIGGLIGGFSSLLVTMIVGYLLDHFNAAGMIGTGYHIVFVYCGVAYLLAWLVFNLLAPRMDRAEIRSSRAADCL